MHLDPQHELFAACLQENSTTVTPTWLHTINLRWHSVLNFGLQRRNQQKAFEVLKLNLLVSIPNEHICTNVSYKYSEAVQMLGTLCYIMLQTMLTITLQS